MDTEVDENSLKILDMCRACLARTENMKSLLENNEETTELLTKFSSVSNLEIALGFKYPSYVCAICEEKINGAYEFQQQCKKSNDLIKEYIETWNKQELLNEKEYEIGSVVDLNVDAKNVEALIENESVLYNNDYSESNGNLIDAQYDTEQNSENYSQTIISAEAEVQKIIFDLNKKYKQHTVCVFCQFHAASNHTLLAHISRTHKDLKDLWCSTCNRTFSNLEQHSKEMHADDFKCQFCSIELSNVNNLIEHLNCHLSNILTEQTTNKNKNWLVCKICKKEFLGNQLLQKHLKTHEKCDKCNKTFKSKYRLKTHKCMVIISLKEEKKLEDLTEKSNIVFEETSTTSKSNDLGKISEANRLDNELEDFAPKKLSKRNSADQRMRLDQYSVEDVKNAISRARKRMYKHVTCTYCSFTSFDNRSLSVHMTRVHREFKGSWCSSCNQVFDDLPGHTKEQHSDDLKCPFCNKVKSNMSHFMEHLACHSVERLYKCDICQKSFVSSRHLIVHKECHINERPFCCKVCNKRFLQRKTLNLHLKCHIQCELCQNMFDSQEALDRHDCGSRTVKLEGGNIEQDREEDTLTVLPQNHCKECDKKVRSLPEHINKHHSPQITEKNELLNLCSHCGKQFKSRSKLNVHMRVHTGEKPYKCHYCDKRVSTKNILIVHERTHTGEKPYICSVCGKGFAQSSMLNTHLRIHTGRPEQCNICQKRFCRPAELKLHMRKHTGEKPYACDHCSLSFKQKSHLVDHTKTHFDDRPYKCEYCEKAFKNLGTLKGHVQIHTGEKPYKCSQCPYACRQPYSLTQHMLQHANDKPQPDNPRICSICHRNCSTVAHFVAHYNKCHGLLDINDTERIEAFLVQDSVVISTPSDSFNVDEINPCDQVQVDEINDRLANVNQDDQVQQEDNVEEINETVIIHQSDGIDQNDLNEIKLERIIQIDALGRIIQLSGEDS